MDDETGLVNYKYRMHNVKIGRFFAVDPLAPKYPHYTPYQFSGNRVIDAVEFEGLEPKFTVQEGQLLVTGDHGPVNMPKMKVVTTLYRLNEDGSHSLFLNVEIQKLSTRGDEGVAVIESSITDYELRFTRQVNGAGGNKMIRTVTKSTYKAVSTYELDIEGDDEDNSKKEDVYSFFYSKITQTKRATLVTVDENGTLDFEKLGISLLKEEHDQEIENFNMTDKSNREGGYFSNRIYVADQKDHFKRAAYKSGIGVGAGAVVGFTYKQLVKKFVKGGLKGALRGAKRFNLISIGIGFAVGLVQEIVEMRNPPTPDDYRGQQVKIEEHEYQLPYEEDDKE